MELQSVIDAPRDMAACLAPQPQISERDRRAHERLNRQELEWLKSIRLKVGPVTLIDLSARGALFETNTRLLPGSTAELTITGDGVTETANIRVLRCEISSLARGLVYRGACVFDRTLARLDRRGAPSGGAAVTLNQAQACREEPAWPSAAAPAGGPALVQSFDGWNKLVVKYLDGRLAKGFSQDFHPSRRHFHLWPSIDAPAHHTALVPISQLKAVFFVRDFSGDSTHVERKSFAEPIPGRRIEVTFLDDEVLLGATLSYRPDGSGFFVTPADTNGNNLRVFIGPAAVRHVRRL